MIEVSISVVSAIKLSFTPRLIVKKIKIIAENNLMNCEFLAEVHVAFEKWRRELVELLSKKVRSNLFLLIMGLIDELATLWNCFKRNKFTRYHLRAGIHP